MKRYREVGQFVVILSIFLLFLSVVHRFLIPVSLGLLVSLVFRPVFTQLRIRLRNRTRIAALLSLLLLILGVFLPIFFIGSVVIKDVTHLASQYMSQNHAAAGNEINPVLADLHRGIGKIYPVTREQFERAFSALLSSAATAGKNFTTSLASSIPRVLVAIVFFLISFYFGLVDGPKFVNFLRQNSPFSTRDTDQLFHVTARICNAVVLGAFLAGIVQGIIIGLGYWIVGLPKPVLFGALTAIFGLIPLVGSAPAGIGGTAFLFATGKFVQGLIMAVAFALAGISDNIVKPWVLKGKTSLHPLLGLVSVLGGMKAFGVSGIFLGPVVTALTIVLIQLLHHRVQVMRQEQDNQ